MKRHADIGADLLSSISFPYPVCLSFAIIMKIGMAKGTHPASRRTISRSVPGF